MPTLHQDWFDTREVAPSVFAIEEPLHSESVKSYLVVGATRAALIDTGMGVANIRAEVERLTDLPVVVLQSHAHFDHAGDSWRFDDVRIHIAEAEALTTGRPPGSLARWFLDGELTGPTPVGFDPERYEIRGKAPTGLIEDGEEFDLGGRSLVAMHTPGHSAGLLVFLDRDARTLFSTDAAYLEQLYVLNPDSSPSDYLVSLRRLEAMIPDLDRLLPAHGPTPIEPGHLAVMADGMGQVVDGRNPDDTTDRFHRHVFGQTQILVRLDLV